MARLNWANSSGIAMPELEERPLESYGQEWCVKVFDNDTNTYEEVLTILMIATGCTPDEAYIETWEIDHLGACIVHYASEDECHTVAEMISTIGIRVEVLQEAYA